MPLQILADLAKAIIVLGIVCLFGLAKLTHGATISGPEVVEPGTLAVFEADSDGVFIVYPNDPANYTAGKDGRTLYFASKTAGTFTVIFAFIEEGVAKIATTEFHNGGPEPGPEPEPIPTPKPELTELERETAKWAFSSVLSHIEAGRIKTPQGVRATFKQAISARIPDISETFSKTLDEWTERTDFSDVNTIKKSFARILEELN